MVVMLPAMVPLVQARHAVVHGDMLAAEVEFPFAHARPLQRIGDGHEAIGAFGGDDGGDHRGVDVYAVAHHFGEDVIVIQRGAHQAGVAVMERRHGVEEMRGMRGARVEAGHGLIVSRRGMAQRGDDAAFGQPGDQFQRAGRLRRQRDNEHLVGKFIEQRGDVPGALSFGGKIASGGWAPLKSMLMKLLSRCTPSRRAPGTPCALASCKFSSTRRSSTGGQATVVGS